MRLRKLAWLGTRTEKFGETSAFFQEVLGLEQLARKADFSVLKLPDGSKVEVFGSGSADNRHFTTGPVVGFLVDDVGAATEELRQAGVEIVFGPQSAADGSAWVHFKAPDGNLYELTQDPAVRG